MAESSVNKLGSYPNADQVNLFGTFYLDFFRDWKQYRTKENCWADFMAAIGIAKANQDKDFKAKYDAFDFKSCGLPEMAGLMHEAWALGVRKHWFSWPAQPTFNYEEGLREIEANKPQ